MFLEADIDIDSIKFICALCSKLIHYNERPSMQTVEIYPCKCNLKEEK